MTKRSDNIIQFDPKRRRKPVPPQETPKKPKKPLPKLNMGYLVIGLFLLGYLGINFLNNRPQSGALEFTVKGDTAYGFGTTDSSSYGYVSEFLNAQPQVKRLVLKNMPGTIDGRTNMQIAALIRKRRLSTHLEHDSYIASGAVDLFIAGAQRSMVCGAKIGVHSWRTASGSSPDTVARDSYAPFQQSFLKDMGIDPDFYAFTRDAAPHHDIHIMTQKEIEQFKLLTVPADCG